MAWNALFGEKATTKIAAFFDTQDALEQVSSDLRRVSDLQNTQLWVVRPHEASFDRKLEPESQGVARTAVRAHLMLGGIGLMAGLLVWAVLYWMALPAILSSPFYSGGFIVALGAVAGLLLGGLVTSRPDHQIVIRAVDDATKAGRWSLVIHPRDELQCKSVEGILAEAGVESARSI